MKQHLFLAVFIICAAFTSLDLYAQKTPSTPKKSEEIIIRKNGNNTSKTIIEIDGDSVTINGKPLSEYKDGDISVIQRDLINRGSHNSMFLPENDQDFEVFAKDSNHAKPKAFLGVMMNETDKGVMLTDVVKGSSAEKAGLQRGDVITKLNDTKITTSNDLTGLIKEHKPGDEVKIYYIRENRIKDVKVKLGATHNTAEAFLFDNNNGAMNNDAFNFKMNQMPRLQPMNKLYNFRFNDNDRPKLGLKIEDTESNNGVKVMNVEEGSAADKAGIKKDDIITSVNDEKVNSVDEMRDQLDDNYDKTVHVKALRNNSEMNFEINIPKKLNSAEL